MAFVDKITLLSIPLGGVQWTFQWVAADQGDKATLAFTIFISYLSTTIYILNEINVSYVINGFSAKYVRSTFNVNCDFVLLPL